VVADILDVLSHRKDERRLPVWTRAAENDVADPTAYVCRRAYLFEGCQKCAEKAKKALGAQDAVFLEGSRFALISSPLSEKAAVDALAATGLCPILTLPVLD